MLLGTGNAHGKVILFGEHAVVYGRPALAVPVNQVQATATVRSEPAGAGFSIAALDIGVRVTLRDAGQPLAAAARLALDHLCLSEPDWQVSLTSTIPIASGLGSGAAVSAALIRALAAAAGQPIEPEIVSALVYEIDKLYHGTPSGVDNTVIAYGQPVYFVRGQTPEPFTIRQPFMLAVADSGIASPTRIAVSDVRRAWELQRPRYEAIFDEIAAITLAARRAIEEGDPARLGELMDRNQRLLAEIGVSCPELETLLGAARTAGAGGAKLSGGGRGGNLIALITADTAGAVRRALLAAGAVGVIVTTVGA